MTYLVILDSGHGLNTLGKRTPLFADGTFMHENEFNRSVVRKIDNILEQYENIDVVFTTTEKRDIDLDERVSRVNTLYDKIKTLYDKIVLISVHANALTGEWGSQNGTETYYYPTNMVDKAFAETIHKHLIKSTQLRDRGVIGEKFYIIKNVKMTACLCECAFMDNLKEAELLKTDEFRDRCANGIVNGLLEYFDINQKKEVDSVVRYKKYSDRIHELRGEVKDLGIKIVNKSNRSIEEPNCVNGTFFWHTDKPYIKYSTSILYADGKIYQAAANHLPDPQSVFIVYKNNTVELKRIQYISELDLNNIRLVIGGVGIRNTLDSFRYNPSYEGFKGAYADVLRKSNKTLIGYNKRLNKVYLLALRNVTMTDVINIVSDNSTGEAYDICLMLDGGGSAFLNNETDMVVYGDGRIIHNIILFE